MKKLMFVCVILPMLFAVSCKKDDKDEPKPQVKSDYLNLKVGNYWVYEHYKIDSLGNETHTSYVDSVVITRDTMINNLLYYVFEGVEMSGSQWKTLGYYRDSAKCLVDRNGNVIFSEINFSDTINEIVSYITPPDTLFYIYTLMEDPGKTITVPAGTFNALNAKGYLTMHYSYIAPGNEIYHVELNRYFGFGVGEILSTWTFANEYYSSRAYYEKRLVRYHMSD